jgi:hypothetical protein
MSVAVITGTSNLNPLDGHLKPPKERRANYGNEISDYGRHRCNPVEKPRAFCWKGAPRSAPWRIARTNVQENCSSAAPRSSMAISSILTPCDRRWRKSIVPTSVTRSVRGLFRRWADEQHSRAGRRSQAKLWIAIGIAIAVVATAWLEQIPVEFTHNLRA